MEQQLGKYVLTDLIAVGGMAEIFRARTTSLGGVEKVLAIKRLHEHYCSDRDFVDMLVNEARIAVRLSHKNIAQVYDLEQEGNTYFLAMEYVHGRDLSRVLRRFQETDRLMPLPCALYVAQEICSGLSFAHRMPDNDGHPLNIIHRDISPQNVLVSFEGEVKLVDFGIAKAASRAAMTNSGVIKGKFYYMSPEQARGDRLDQRADIFSVGAILYEMATGRMLYEGEDDARLVQRVRRADYAPPSSVSPDVPPQLEQIILKALARDLNQRFQTARDLQLALSGMMHSFGAPFDSISLSELMHGLYQTGGDSASAVYQVVAEGTDPRAAAPLPTDPNWAKPPVDEDASTSIYAKEHIGDIVAQIDAAAAAGRLDVNAPRRAPMPAVARDVDLAIDREVYRINTVITGPDGMPLKAKKAPSTLLYLLAVGGVLLLAWAFVFATNQLVLGSPKETSGPRVHAGSGESAGVLINSLPAGASIWLDGSDTGLVTPASLTNLGDGNHNVTLKLRFHEDVPLTISAKQHEPVEAVLSPRKGILQIGSTPPGAQVHVDGKPVGTAPVNLDGQDMSVPHRVAASLNGYRDVVTTVQWVNETPVLPVEIALSRGEQRYGDVAEGLLAGAAQAGLGLVLAPLPPSQPLVDPTLDPNANTVVEPANPDGGHGGSNKRNDKRKPEMGTISVNSKPPGDLWVDGRRTGKTTPVQNYPLPAGYHNIKVYYPTLNSFSGEKQTLIKPGSEAKLLFRQ